LKRKKQNQSGSVPDSYEERMRRRELRLQGEEIPYAEDTASSPKHKRTRRKIPLRKKIKIGVLLLLLLLVLDMVRLMTCYHYDNTDAAAMSIQDDVVNIALFGVDTRESDPEIGTRADAIMIMSVSAKTGKIKLISLMRDSYVNVPGYGMTKLGHAYSYGGPQLAIQTINEAFDMDISEYITVNFGEMAAIINAVGGVRINVTKAERKETNKYIKEYCNENGLSYKKNRIAKSGEQKLNGIQAMTYGRIRKGNTGGDWMRAERQSVVLNQVFAKASSNPITLLRFLNGLMPNVTTSLSRTDFLRLGIHSLRRGMPTLEHARLPLDGEWEYSTSADGLSIITFSDQVLSTHLHEYIYDDVPLTADAADS
jgi:LCP family protein required for cell wall assembly